MEKRECRVGICDDRVEDARRIRDALGKALQKEGQPVRLSCHCFTDGEKLYEAAGREAFDLIFLDIEMPGLDGFGLAEKLCREHPAAYLAYMKALCSIRRNIHPYGLCARMTWNGICPGR